MTTILVADDEEPLRESLATMLRDNRFEVFTAATGREAVEVLNTREVTVALIDIRMPGCGGMEILQQARDLCPGTHIILITAFGSVENAVEALKMGASDYVAKPLVFDDILLKIKRLLDYQQLSDENQFLHTELGDKYSAEGIVGVSQSLRQVVERVKKLARTRTSALITGESGSGKELIARAIHYSGVTSDGRFLPVNCAAMPDSLVESELFGHTKGAFSGATTDKPGKFQVADGGTLFLDEISCMPLSTQPKLLRAIEEQRIVPVGSNDAVEVEARILCATKENLKEEVEQGNFREDLYYRLAVVEVEVPPLRQRREDIPPLVDHFVHRFSRELKRPHCGVSDETMRTLMSYSWPGNVRELKNAIERALIFAEARPLQHEDLPLAVRQETPPACRGGDLNSAMQAFERQYIQEALRRNEYDKEATAEKLDIGLSSLYRKMDQLDIRKNPEPQPVGA